MRDEASDHDITVARLNLYALAIFKAGSFHDLAREPDG
jgi:hypothetical protein